MNNTDVLNLFASFLLALIVKDFYDIFIQEHIRKYLGKYKILIKRKVEYDKMEK